MNHVFNNAVQHLGPIGVLVMILAFIALSIVLAPKMAQAGHNLKDIGLRVSKTLAASATSATSAFIDTGTTSFGSQMGAPDWRLSAPATGTNLGDAHTVKYDILMSDNADGSSPTTLYTSLITQTGASSAGAAAATQRFRLPSDAKRYIGAKATNGSAEDLSAASMVLEVLV